MHNTRIYSDNAFRHKSNKNQSRSLFLIFLLDNQRPINLQALILIIIRFPEKTNLRSFH